MELLLQAPANTASHALVNKQNKIFEAVSLRGVTVGATTPGKRCYTDISPRNRRKTGGGGEG